DPLYRRGGRNPGAFRRPGRLRRARLPEDVLRGASRGPGLGLAQRPGDVRGGPGVAFQGRVRGRRHRAGRAQRPPRPVPQRRRRHRGGARTRGGARLPGPQVLLRLLRHKPPPRAPDPARVLGRRGGRGDGGDAAARSPRAPAFCAGVGPRAEGLLVQVPALDGLRAQKPRRRFRV
ncbi:MAG: hypothetical protein AVDCRST_MAG22-2056, partial [uncultured Rubrobacteraceae bacterium]